ncbi:MAG: heme exporter protein CcmD [Pikeienuella sp.]
MSGVVVALYDALVRISGDPYAPYVVGAYGLSAVILGGLIWASLVANLRARRELEEVEKDRHG